MDWPYQGATVLDEDLKVHQIAHVVACTESNDSYKFGLVSMTSIEPALHRITKVVFSDRLASESLFFECLRSLGLAALCNWHLRVQNLGEKIKFHPSKEEIMEDFMWTIQNALVSPEQLDANWKAFLEKWPGAPALFLASLESQKHRFCAAYTHKHLLLFQTGNSVAESTNSSIDAFLNENKPHTELVQVLIQHQTEQNNRERRQLFISCKQLPDRLALVSNCDIRNCL